MLGITIPGTESGYEEHDGQRTAWLLHPDGSWARATATGNDRPDVRQAGPRRLWDTLDAIRHQQVLDGRLPAHGAKVTITPDGAITFTRGKWTATMVRMAERRDALPSRFREMTCPGRVGGWRHGTTARTRTFRVAGSGWTGG